MTAAVNGSARQAALTEWQQAAVAGTFLSGAELARQFDRSPSWGRQVVREARMVAGASEPPVAEEVPVTVPVSPPAAAGGPDGTDSRAAGDDVPFWVKRLTVVAVLVVTLAAAVASVDHLADLARLAGTTGWRAWLLPAAVDGLAVAAALTLYGAHRGGLPAGTLPWLALLGGLGASVAGNILAVYPELVDVGHLKVAVGATPPLSLALSVELALRQIRTHPTKGTS